MTVKPEILEIAIAAAHQSGNTNPVQVAHIAAALEAASPLIAAEVLAPIDPESDEVWQLAKTIVDQMTDETYDSASGYVLRDDPRNLALILMRAGYRRLPLSTAKEATT